MAHHGWTEHARLTGSQIAQIERGEKHPRRETLYAILRGTDTTPRDWPKVVQLAVVSAELDPRLVGVDHAAAALKKLSENRTGAVLWAALDDPARQLERALEDAAPGPAEPQRGRAQKRAANQANGSTAAPKKRARRRAQ